MHSKIAAYLYEVRILPTGAAVLSAILGFLYAGGSPSVELLVYTFVVSSALYCGHAVDSIVDYHFRGERKYVYMGIFEDSGGLLSARELGAAAVVASVLFWAALASLAGISTTLFLISVAGWVIALIYSPLLDRNPFTVSLAYPVGVALALFGGYILGGGEGVPLVALPILLYLVGGKIVSDLIDYKDDSQRNKRTVVVVLGSNAGRTIGYMFSSTGLAVAFLLIMLGNLPEGSMLGIVSASILLLKSYTMRPPKSVLVLVAGGYLFLVSMTLHYLFILS